MICICGRGHGGTRIPSKLLHKNGVFMGAKLNQSADLVPPHKMYQAVQHINKFVKYKGNYEWDFSYLINNEPDKKFISLINEYLHDVLEHSEPKGWKLPETTFAFPWLIKMFPNIKYIFWYRHPYDSIISNHLTDDLNRWNINFPEKDLGLRMKRAISWKYQYDMINCIPPPNKVIHIKYEDFCLNTKKCVNELESFLKMKLKPVKTHTDSVYKWKRSNLNFNRFKFLKLPIKKLGYQD